MKDKNLHIIHQYLNGEVDIESIKQQLSEEEFQEWSETLALIKAMPKFNFDVEKEFDLLQKKKQEIHQTKGKYNYLKIAAILILLIATSVFTATYFYDNTSTINITSEIANNDFVKLPDNSQVRLNATSSISYSEEEWGKERRLLLNGEAYFDVEKGERFTVETQNGTVQVLGTTFNVNSRTENFSVTCYTGKVKVNFSGTEFILKSGQSVSKASPVIFTTSQTLPDWMANRTSFEATLLSEVIQDIEHQKKVDINLNVSESIYFTGAYDHDMDTEAILDLLCQSLNLTFIKISSTEYEVVLPEN